MANDSNTTVSLGCGTLILIAIIVAIFSNGSDLSNDIRRLRSEVRDLKQEVQSLHTSVQGLQTTIRARNAEQPARQ